MDFIKWDVVAQTLDYVNMMTYDMTGTWDKIAYHNSPLRKTDGGDPTLNIDAVVAHLITKYNVPRNKIIIGAAFYGQRLNGSELFGPISGGTDPLPYTQIMGIKNSYQEFWDDKAKVPYLINKGANSFISYDNPRSIEAKGQFVVDNQLAGVIVWEVSNDGGVLASALAKGLCNPISTGVGQQLAAKSVIFPNPVHDILNIAVEDGGVANQVAVINAIGQEVYSGQFNNSTFKLNMEGFDNGLYFVRITNEYGVSTEKILVQR